ncbi:MAG: KpsF/GutQ family sugar-phosphate isomerase [Vampirovibrionales bacterium]|nr:KpsF/GutQ family sugar-phosphate isomerase [Vampirovibrionales bacterium]
MPPLMPQEHAPQETPRICHNSGELIKQDYLSEARHVFAVEQAGLTAVANRLDASFERAIDVLLACKGRVIVTGIGKSGIIGKKIAATLASTGTPACFMHPTEGSHGDLGLLTRDDVVLAISYSGQSDEVLSLLPAIKRLGLPIIAMTRASDSLLAQRSDVSLNIAVPEEACPMGLAPTASTTATLALGDALAVVLLKSRGFTANDFALVHPAGSLGKRLLLTVQDLMHTGDALPMVTPEASFLEALLEMGDKKLGMTLVMSPDRQRLVGILTDGDVRRALTRPEVKTQGVHHLCVQDVLETRTPKTITPDDLAVSAMRLMESHQITALVVMPAVDSSDLGRPLGVIHLHDILRQGLG